MTETIQITASTEEWSGIVCELTWLQDGTPETATRMETVDKALLAACPGWFAEDGEIVRLEHVTIELDEEIAGYVVNLLEEQRGCECQ